MKRIVFAAAALLAALAAGAATADRQLVNTIWLGLGQTRDFSRLNQNGRIDRYLDTCKARGCTAVSFDISWNIETRDGQYDFAAADAMADAITSRGLGLFIRLNTSLLARERPKWITESMLMRTPNGRVYTRNGREAVPAITDRTVQKKMAEFYTAVARHFAQRRRPDVPAVTCFSAAFDLYMESEYSPGADLDYSPPAQRAFLTWLDERTRGTDIKTLNAQWGTKFNAAREITLLTAPPALRYQFFAWTLDALFTRLGRALRSGDPRAKFGVQFGCLWDNPRRRSMLVDLRNPAIDWVFVADAPNYNHGFTVDMLRASARGKMISNEIDGPIPGVMTDELAYRQGRDSFVHGADAVFICNWRPEKFGDRAAWTFPDKLGALAREERRPFQPKRALYVSTWDLVNLTGNPKDYQSVYDELTESGTGIVDVLNDCALLADAEKLKDYDEIVLPANRTIATAARQVLEKIPASKLRIIHPDRAGLLDEFGKMVTPLIGK